MVNADAPIIFVNGCSSCGYVGQQLRRVKRLLSDVVVKNSRYDLDARKMHAELLASAGIEAGQSYPPIVLVRGTVTRLEQWMP